MKNSDILSQELDKIHYIDYISHLEWFDFLRVPHISEHEWLMAYSQQALQKSFSDYIIGSQHRGEKVLFDISCLWWVVWPRAIRKSMRESATVHSEGFMFSLSWPQDAYRSDDILQTFPAFCFSSIHLSVRLALNPQRRKEERVTSPPVFSNLTQESFGVVVGGLLHLPAFHFLAVSWTSWPPLCSPAPSTDEWLVIKRPSHALECVKHLTGNTEAISHCLVIHNRFCTQHPADRWSWSLDARFGKAIRIWYCFYSANLRVWR